MRATARRRAVLLSLYRGFCFFLILAFFLTCCMLLFLRTLAGTMGIEFSATALRPAAVLTALNATLLSLAFTLLDVLRRRWTVERPVRAITQAVERLMAGDFSARVSLGLCIASDNGLGRVARCFDRMAEALSDAEQLRTNLAANVSHELKTPLAAMQNYASLLRQPGLTEQQRMAYAGEVEAACRRMTALVTNILRLDRLENQQVFPEAREYDLGEQLCECLVGFERVWEEKHLDLETDIPEGVTVRMDPELVSLVWNDLISNAMKFTEPGGRISVSLETEGDWAVVRVSDTGCGISQEVGAHMFERFYQGDTSHASQGNGLGLALVKRAIDIVGGEISVSSQVGKGSTFTVKIGRGQDESV